MSCKERISGVYLIRFKTSGKIYVGSSKDVMRRRNEHLKRLRSRTHKNQLMQHEWDFCGEADFEFSILERQDVYNRQELLSMEERWMNTLHSFGSDHGLNIHTKATGGPPAKYSDYMEKLIAGEYKISFEQFCSVIDLLVKTSMPLVEVAKLTGVHRSTVNQIYYHEQYRELTSDFVFQKREPGGRFPRILSDADAKDVVRKLQNGQSPSCIAKEKKVSCQTIKSIYHHKTYREFTEDCNFPKCYEEVYSSPIMVCTNNGTYKQRYETIEEASEATNVAVQCIRRYCRGDGVHRDFSFSYCK